MELNIKNYGRLREWTEMDRQSNLMLCFLKKKIMYESLQNVAKLFIWLFNFLKEK